MFHKFGCVLACGTIEKCNASFPFVVWYILIEIYPLLFCPYVFLVADRKSYQVMKTEGFRRKIIATHLQVIECLRVASFYATNVQRVTARTCNSLKTTWAFKQLVSVEISLNDRAGEQ